ncbi:Uncharacterised protein [Mycobacteroides abscessus subsp. abscessus]|nr:Uncharacterised protein [Mycobacteroides abscessus subsp. abscessus]
MRREPLVVVVVARPAVHPTRLQLNVLTGVEAVDLCRPQLLARRPVQRGHLVLQSQVLVDLVLIDGLAKVLHDAVGIGDRLLVDPRLELESKRMQVTVRPDTRIAEQVPGATNRLATLEKREAFLRHLLGHVVGRSDTGDTRPDDQNVQRFDRCGCCGHLRLLRSGSISRTANMTPYVVTFQSASHLAVAPGAKCPR